LGFEQRLPLKKSRFNNTLSCRVVTEEQCLQKQEEIERRNTEAQRPDDFDWDTGPLTSRRRQGKQKRVVQEERKVGGLEPQALEEERKGPVVQR